MSVNMKAFVVAALESFCQNNEIFGESGAVYEGFKLQVGADNANDGFNSSTLFGRIVYRSRGDEHVSPPLMLKTMPRLPLFKDYAQVQFFNEIFFYTRALPAFQQLRNAQSLFPQLYDNQIRVSVPADDFVLIFENLRPQGFRLPKPYSFLDLEHLSLVLRKLGNFHAYSYCAKRRNASEFYALGKWFYCPENIRADRLPGIHSRRMARGLQRLRQDGRYSDRLQGVEHIVENANHFLDRMSNLECKESQSVLCHGCCIRGHVMFRYDENGQPCDLKMIDMAWCKIVSPVVDLSTVLYLNADQCTRSAHWDQLIDSYYEGLVEIFGGEGVPSRSEVVNEFRTKALYGYFIASMFLPTAIAMDGGVKNFQQLFGQEYAADCCYSRIPQNELHEALDTVGGAEGTEALADILRDIIDRNFV